MQSHQPSFSLKNVKRKGTGKEKYLTLMRGRGSCNDRMYYPGDPSGKDPVCQRRRHKSHERDRRVQKMPWRRAWQLIPVFLPGESLGQRSLAGCSAWSHKESHDNRLSTQCFQDSSMLYNVSLLQAFMAE